MKFSSFIVAVIPFMLSCSNTQAANLNSAITWFEFDSPPYYIVKGTLKNQGLAQIFRRELETLLPHYNHQVRQGNFVRGLGEIEKRDNVCATSLLKTKAYEKFAYFSEPWIMVMANGLNVRTNDLNQYKAFISDGTLDLHALLTQSDFVLGKLNARPYGVTIDKIINDFEDNSRLFNLTGSSKMHDLLHLFTKRKQVDGVLGYAAEIQYYANEYQMAADAITYLPCLLYTSPSPRD